MIGAALARIEFESVPIGRSEQPAPIPVAMRSPRTADRSDDRLVETVKSALCAAGYAELRNLKIETRRGVVVLWGRVPTYHLKQLAQVTVQQVEGVRGIANGLEVACHRRGTSNGDRH